jgi:hypothetical protein
MSPPTPGFEPLTVRVRISRRSSEPKKKRRSEFFLSKSFCSITW